MKPLFAVAAMLVSLAASAQDSDLAGRYTLQGAAEARSEMLLKADGTFDWRMAYGEIEFNTKGTWPARDGKAIKMADGEQWKRVGLRKKASTAPYQWIDVPSARAAERLAGFTVTNHETLMPAPFETLVLTRKGTDLVIGSETGGTAIYRKN